MKHLILVLILLSSTAFARTRSFFKTEEAYAMKAVHNGNFDIQGRSAAVISEYDNAKLVVFKTNGNITGQVSAKGVQSILVHSMADNFAYALFYDKQKTLPSPVSNNLSSYLSQSDVRTMKFGSLRSDKKYNKLSNTISKNSEVELLVFELTDKAQINGLGMKLCSDQLTPKGSGTNYKHYQFVQKESCLLQYKAPENSSFSYFMITNNLLPVVKSLLVETRQIIKHLSGKLKRETANSKPNKVVIDGLNKKIQNEKRELRLLKQFLERINEQ